MTENKGDLISREALKKALRQRQWHIDDIEEVMKIIDNAPTVSLQDIYQEGHYDGHLEGYTKAINEEKPQGEWIIIKSPLSTETVVKCPFCHDEFIGNDVEHYNFCPECGALMMKGGET